MNSLSLMRFVSKNGYNRLISRQLSLQSIQSVSRVSPKVMPNNVFIQNNGNNTNELLVGKRAMNQSLLEQLSTRSLSSTPTLSAAAPAATQSHSHAKLWSLERYVSIGLLGVIPAGLMFPNPALDYLLALSLVTHIHWGLDAIVVDYIRPQLFGSLIPKIAVAYVYMLSIAALAGLFYFNYTDVGLGVAVRMAAKL